MPTPARSARAAHALAAGLLALGVLAGACSSDAGKGDTKPQNNTDNPSQGGTPGASVGGGNAPQGQGTGTGRATP
ncbi:MAG: hypothetical protein QOK43_1100 [Acidimicrobiaceae bacterium]|jgi:hypothetical protein|nr:hypothetical protein [Acidimicrobiaceae bacterium]MDQ1445814.1 hypothetical protein [Acidimicrobiaceae bacterium]